MGRNMNSLQEINVAKHRIFVLRFGLKLLDLFETIWSHLLSSFPLSGEFFDFASFVVELSKDEFISVFNCFSPPTSRYATDSS